MHVIKRGIQTIIIGMLLIYITIGTPFFASIANEIFEQDKIIETIPPTENTILTQETIETFPVNTVDITTDETTLTYRETENNTSDTVEVTSGEYQDITTADNNTTTIETILSGDTITTGTINNTTGDTNATPTISPVLITTPPAKSLIIISGLIDSTSLQSYNVIDQNSDTTYCSYISYLNLKHITQLPDTSFVRGNAIDIRTQHKQEAITDTNDMIFTGVNTTGQAFISYLEQQYSTYGTSLFDIITFQAVSSTNEPTVNQSHRFIVFLGTDHEWYVLDPVRTLSSDPILLNTYLKNYIVDQEHITLLQTYDLHDTRHTDTLSTLQTITSTTGQTTDQQEAIVIHSPMEFLPYVLQGFITSTTSGELISNQIIFHTGFRYETISGDLSAYIPAGLVIKTADLKDFNVSLLNINEIEQPTIDKTLISEYSSAFQFGSSGQHLIFSQPVAITVQTPNHEDGDILNLMVQHEGHEWNKQGLTNNPNAICESDGAVSKADQGFVSTVHDKKIIFYTCGASSFTLGYVPGLNSPNGIVYSIGEQTNGKKLIGGAFTTVGGVARNRIARLNSDKTLDTTFNPNLNNNLLTIKAQSDEKILIGGAFTTVGGTVRNYIARLNSDGSLDVTFNPNSNNSISTIALQSDGKILIGGDFTTLGGVARNRIARLNSDGTLDTTFNPNASATVSTIALQSDGKILIGGSFTTIGGVARNRIARLNSDGTLDTTFNPNANNSVATIALQPDENILIGGAFTTVGGIARNRIARLNSDGTLDTTFNPNANNSVATIALQSDGKILIGGAFTTVGAIVRNYIARLNSDGSLDVTFNPNASAAINDIELQSDGKILIGGAFITLGGVTQAYLAYYNNNILDTVYNVRPNGVVNKILTQPDGKILIGGAFSTIGGVARNRIARLNSDGTLDTTFNPNANNSVATIALQPDGKILIGGAFTTLGGVARNRIARLNSDGTLDTTFNPNASATVSTITLQSDGKILIGGAFTTVGAIVRNYIARLNSDGSLDTTFNPNASAAINDIELQADGKILIGGAFVTLSGVARNRIARLNSDGTLDTTFNPNANNSVATIALQSDGKILIGGAFTTVGGIVRNRIARLTPTGTLDTTFNPNASATVNTIYLLANNDIIIGGSFATIGGVSRLQLAKISTTGVLDTDFNISFSASTMVNSIDKDFEGNLIVGGSFTTLNNLTTNVYFGRIGLNKATKNLSLWLKANDGINCISDGCSVSQWNDNSMAINNAVQISPGAQPIYRTNVLNGNPVINFNSTSQHLISTTVGSYKTIFAVRNLPMTGYQTLFSAPTGSDFSLRNAGIFDGITNLNYTDGPNINDWSNGGLLAIDGKTTNIGKTRYHLVRAITPSVITNNYSVSSTFNNRGMYGNDAVAELIAYSTALDTTTTNTIESYLAIKYGITLDQSEIGGQNYTLSNNLLSWSATIAGGYKNDIAGIVVDTAMELSQTKSQSINNTGDIIIEATSTPNNLTSLVWANNGGNITFSTNEKPITGINQRITRERQMQEKNGDVGNITITYPIGTGGGTTENLTLLVDNDGDFSNGSTTLITGSIVGGYRTFTTNISDGQYITFGISRDETLCIESPSTLILGSGNAKNIARQIDALSDYFKVNDQKGSANGYYTTLAISALTGSNGQTISTSAIQFKANPIATLGGTSNPAVILDPIISTYTAANMPVQFIKRNSNTGQDILGTYGSTLSIRINVPAYQSIGSYTGTITYTLYEN